MAAGRAVRWITLAFIPSSLTLGVTTYISTDIAAVPLIWVVPLALYLATFVIAFGQRARGEAPVAERRVPLLATIAAVFMALPFFGANVHWLSFLISVSHADRTRI